MRISYDPTGPRPNCRSAPGYSLDPRQQGGAQNCYEQEAKLELQPYTGVCEIGIGHTRSGNNSTWQQTELVRMESVLPEPFGRLIMVGKVRDPGDPDSISSATMARWVA